MRSVDKGGAVVAALLAGVASSILWQAQDFTAFASIFPRAVGIALLLCSLLVLWRSLRGTNKPQPDADGGGLLRSALLAGVMLLWVALLESAGFALASWAGFFALALLANRDPLGAKRLAGFALAALLCVLLLQLLFQRGLDVRLPVGTWLAGLVG